MTDLNSTILGNIKTGNLFFSIISIFFSLTLIVWFFLVNSLRSMTYYFFLFIACSEVFGNVGNILLSQLAFKAQSNEWQIFFINLLQVFSDSSTLMLLGGVSYFIYELIKNNNRTLMDKKTIVISSILGISFAYSLCLSLINKFCLEDKKVIKILYLAFKEDSSNIVIKIIHQIIMTIYCVISYYFVVNVSMFIRQKAKEDPNNAEKLLSVGKSIYNFPLVGSVGILFAWAVFGMGFSSETEDNNVRLGHIFSVFCSVFTALRGFLVFMMFISTNKVQTQIKEKAERILRNMQKMNMFQLVEDSNESSKKTIS